MMMDKHQPSFTETERNHLRELASKIAAASSTVTDRTGEPVVHVTFWSLTERDLAVRAMEAVASPSSDAAEGAGVRSAIFNILSEEITQPRPEYLPAHFNNAVTRLTALFSAPPKPASDAMRVDLADKFRAAYRISNYDHTDQFCWSLSVDERELIANALSAPDGAGEPWQPLKREDTLEILKDFRSRKDTVDRAADRIEAHVGTAISSALKMINARYSPPPTGAAEPDAVRDLPLLWQGRANTLRILNSKRTQIDQATCGEADCYEQCAKELRELLSAPAVVDEHHTARFLARLVYYHGVAYGPGIESADAWVDANWQAFREDARRLGSIAPAVGVTREVPPIERVECVQGFLHVEPADPEWRLEIGGICADFPTEVWANNFRNAILALSPVPDATVSATPQQVQEACAQVADCAVASDEALAIRYPDEAAKFEQRAHRGKTIAASIRAMIPPSPQDVGREATVEGKTGFGVYSFGTLDVTTVSPTRRGAIVNWLVTSARSHIFARTSDEEIEQRWRDCSSKDHECVHVVVSRSLAANGDGV